MIFLKYEMLRKHSNFYEMASAIVLTSEQWFLLSGTENTDGGLIINLNEMQKTPGHYQSKETSTSSNSLHMFYVLFVEVDSLSILYTYVIRAGRGQYILVLVDMITAIFKVWLYQNSV
jgi:hypothetical protein